MGRKIRSSLMTAVVVVPLASLVLAGCTSGGGNGPDRDASGQVVAPSQIEALDIRLADCFNNPGQDSVEEVVVVPCDQAHDFEVFHSFRLADGSYPGSETIQKQWYDGCLAEFESFVGRSFVESSLDVSAIFPTEQTWNELGDREVLCSVTAADGVRRAGSAEDSGV